MQRKLLALVVALALASVVAAQRSRTIPKPAKAGPESYYQALGVEPTATAAELRKAYRKAAVVHHPDKLPPGSSAEEQEAANAMFIKLANMFEVLSDQMLRDRYDSLLAIGVYEYDPSRNYDAVDQEKGHKPKPNFAYEKFRYRDARAQFTAAEDADAKAFFIAFGLAGILAAVPIVRFYSKKAQKKPAVIPKDELRDQQLVLEQMRKEQAAEQAAAKQAQREEREERRKAEAELRAAQKEGRERAEGEDAEREGAGEGEADGAAAGDGKEDISASSDDEKDAGSAFKCDVCRKSFKSEQMLGQHENSKKHKEAVKKAGGRKKREDKRGEGQAAAVAPKKEEGWQEPESEDGPVAGAGVKGKQAKKQKKQSALQKLASDLGKESAAAHSKSTARSKRRRRDSDSDEEAVGGAGAGAGGDDEDD